MAEFQLRRIAQQIVDAVGRMTELKTAQVGQQLIAFLRSHGWTSLTPHPPPLFFFWRAFSARSRS